MFTIAKHSKIDEYITHENEYITHENRTKRSTCTESEYDENCMWNCKFNVHMNEYSSWWLCCGNCSNMFGLCEIASNGWHSWQIHK